MKPSNPSPSTPGPWEFRKAQTLYIGNGVISGQPGEGLTREDVPFHVVAVDRDDQNRKRTRFIAQCNGANLPNEANTHLIAAAPAMFEALQDLLFVIEVNPYWGPEQRREFDKATKKAEAALSAAQPEGK